MAFVTPVVEHINRFPLETTQINTWDTNMSNYKPNGLEFSNPQKKKTEQKKINCMKELILLPIFTI